MDLSNLFSPRLQLSGMYAQSKHFIVVGAGGTGGYLIPQLARQIAIQNRIRGLEGLSPHYLTIIDGDIVEEKNLIRQNFVDRDMNKNKAEVMAERYGRAYQLSIDYVTDYIVDVDMLRGLVHQDDENPACPVFIDCVDNNKTRAFIQEAHRSYTKSYFISSGNEEMTGQVVLSLQMVRNQNLETTFGNERFGAPVTPSTPSIIDMFPSMLDGSDKLPTEMSCAENAESAPQNIHTNMTAANLIFGFANKILAKPQDLTKGIDHFAIFYNLNNMTFRTLSTTEEDFMSALQMTADNPAISQFFPSRVVVSAPKKRAPRKPRTQAVEAESAEAPW